MAAATVLDSWAAGVEALEAGNRLMMDEAALRPLGEPEGID